MGGEWFFHYYRDSGRNNTKPPFDISKYQELLLEIKKQYEKKFNEEHVQWCDINALPPTDNVFVRFKFTCNRHDWGNEHPWFNLYWVPPNGAEMHGSLHDRCTFNDFNENALFHIQRTIFETFPDHFYLERDWTDSKEYVNGKWRYHNCPMLFHIPGVPCVEGCTQKQINK